MAELLQIFRKFYNLIRKILIYYFPRVATYWDLPTPRQINHKVYGLGKYYLDFKKKYFYPGTISEKGIPLYKFNGETRDCFHPTVICNYAMAIHSMMFMMEFTDKSLNEQFLTQADWLVENQQNLVNGAGWYLKFEVPEYSLNAPWISALTQGEAISVLCRAYALSKKEIYVSAAERAFIPFQYCVKDGGLINYFKEIMILEEYPSTRVNVALNGFIFAIFGIYDLYLTNQNNLAKDLYDLCIGSLIKVIEFFDLGYWTRYNLYHFPVINPASCKYHNLHVEQLKTLYFLTGNDYFKQYYERWKFYYSNLSYRNKALYKKLITSCKNSKPFSKTIMY